ncbi:hypothetical protein V6N13_056146 [Hibiscus sabdariffa]
MYRDLRAQYWWKGTKCDVTSLNRTKVSLVYGLQASTECDETASRKCLRGCLDKSLVKNKIVVCGEVGGLAEAHNASALGSILQTSLNTSNVVPLPASALRTDDYKSLLSYLNSTKQPIAEILKSVTIQDPWAPPDISAPGVNILAAYSPVVSPSSTATDERRVKYDILSGTSMSCPHVAAVFFLKA